MDLGDLILVLLVVLAVQHLLEFIQAAKDVAKVQEDAVGEIEKEILRTIPVKVEVHYDCYYFFHELTDQFIVQGRDKDEIVTALRARYGKDKKIAVNVDDPVIQRFLEQNKIDAQVI